MASVVDVMVMQRLPEEQGSRVLSSARGGFDEDWEPQDGETSLAFIARVLADARVAGLKAIEFGLAGDDSQSITEAEMAELRPWLAGCLPGVRDRLLENSFSIAELIDGHLSGTPRSRACI
jgi:hypothetical protein